MPTKCCWVIHGSLSSERKAYTSPSSFIKHSTLLVDRALRASSSLSLQGGVENVQYATNHKRKGGGSARAVRGARSASHLKPGLFLAIFLPGIDFVVVQHLIRCLYHKLEKRQQPIVRLIGRSTSLVFGIVLLDFLAVQVSVQFCIRSRSSCSSSWWLIVVRLACRQFSGSGEALGGSGGLCVPSTVTMVHESHPPSWMQLDAKSVGPPWGWALNRQFFCVCVCVCVSKKDER